MVKGVSIALKSYGETVPRVLKLIKLDQELPKHTSIVIKPSIDINPEFSTPVELVEQLVKFCLACKAPEAELFIAEGADGSKTMDLFSEQGYKALAEKYGVGLLDLNLAECESIGSNEFVGFETIFYPQLLKESFVISAPKLNLHDSLHITGSLSNMRGAYPGKYYRGLFGSRKTKLDAYPLKYQVHDIAVAHMPNLAVIDASSQGKLLVGKPLDMDRQAAQLLSLDPNSIGYLRMIEETLETRAQREQALQERDAASNGL